MHGTAEDLGPPSRVPPLVTALAAKYTRPGDWQYLPAADPGFDVAYAMRPRSVLTWDLNDFDGSQRRWSP